MTTSGFLHPGQMGTSIAAACRGERAWCSEGRSNATRARAEAAGLTEIPTLTEFAEHCDTIVSICPPGEADHVADMVAATGFTGTYVDANAISPATTRNIARRFEHYVDGGVIGPPAHSPGTTRLYLSGDDAGTVAALWDGSVLDARAIEGGVGSASAVKMLYAAWGKHNAALMLAIEAAAEAYGAADTIRAEWAISLPDLVTRSESAARGSAPKAWRFEGEMHEVAATFDDAGLPPEFHRGAAEIFRRMAGFKDAAAPVSVEQVVAALLTR